MFLMALNCQQLKLALNYFFPVKAKLNITFEIKLTGLLYIQKMLRKKYP